MSSKDGIQFAESLKTLITSETIQLEPKGVDPYSESNYARVWITTNNRDVVQAKAGEESRRFAAFRSSNKHCKDVELLLLTATYARETTRGTVVTVSQSET